MEMYINIYDYREKMPNHRPRSGPQRGCKTLVVHVFSHYKRTIFHILLGIVSRMCEPANWAITWLLGTTTKTITRWRYIQGGRNHRQKRCRRPGDDTHRRGAEKSLMLENKKRPPDDVNRRWMLFFDKGRPGGNNDEGGVQPRGIFHSSSLTLKFPVQVVCPF